MLNVILTFALSPHEKSVVFIFEWQWLNSVVVSMFA